MKRLKTNGWNGNKMGTRHASYSWGKAREVLPYFSTALLKKPKNAIMILFFYCFHPSGKGGLIIRIMFKVGDLAVYPAHGVGLIESIEEKEIGGTTLVFYVMRILENDMKIMIPKNNTEAVGLRSIISPEEVEKVYSILEEKDVKFTPQTWNRRYREYMERIKTGSIFDLAAVLRDLYILQMDKPLSFGEKKMLETAKTLLVKELSIARNKKEEEIEKGIEEIFGIQEVQAEPGPEILLEMKTDI